MSLEKIQEICNAHGQFAPSANSSPEEAYDVLATVLAYFDNQVRGLTEIGTGAYEERTALKAQVAEQAEALERVRVMVEKYPGWVNDMARVCHEMISNLTVHHRFEHAAPVQKKEEAPAEDVPPAETPIEGSGLLDPC